MIQKHEIDQLAPKKSTLPSKGILGISRPGAQKTNSIFRECLTTITTG